ncbi:hypothetical protein O5O45_05680 [Hahella aquimaris]|uniref:Uncharacterized protein n=1 Tax=Hahella chejuensis (strain KCTC 2396) TaxID=349521 RepID=Q2SDK5_HAHCH|nr:MULTISPECIES: hypothetical protein [Hahella]ABC31269.1 hypothetical protein HCH_04567 [Hahella chejuensis KCTC 2396]WLQ15408.1 hypothetical protein O5O45_05680 [Hahella sp. HNIBRBA332]
MDRDDLLVPTLKVDPKEIGWCFISNYYDAPIEGLVYFRGEIHRFCCFPEDVPDQKVFVVLELNPEEMEFQLKMKEKFERMVGTHWSYDENGNALPESSATPESAKQYYDSKQGEKYIGPYDAKVIAWFDLSKDVDGVA